MSGKRKAPTRTTGAVASVLADQPWWVKTVVWVGVPTAAMGYLLWFVLSGMATRLDHLAATQDQHTKDMTALVTHLQQETQQSWVQLGVMQQICLNTARNEQQRTLCVTSLPRRGE